MPFNVTITKAAVYNMYGILMPVSVLGVASNVATVVDICAIEQ